jgi:peptidyl-prolyl cis-trans isomerase A (cyclophilin A)
MTSFLIRLFACLLVLMLPLLPAGAAPANKSMSGPRPGYVRVKFETDAGVIVVALDAKRAPKTTANFLLYVDDGRLDGTSFYRASRNKAAPGQGFIQGGIDTDFRRTIVPSVVLEPTSQTGIKHLDATITMARHKLPNSATANFSLTVGPAPFLDARPDSPGYAAFGHVVSGMDVVKKILARPTCCGKGPMFGQMLKQQAKIIRAVRLDGTAKPTTFVRPWLMMPSGSKKPVDKKR